MAAQPVAPKQEAPKETVAAPVAPAPAATKVTPPPAPEVIKCTIPAPVVEPVAVSCTFSAPVPEHKETAPVAEKPVEVVAAKPVTTEAPK